MKKIQSVSLLDVMPESILLDPKLKASAQALDVQIQAVTNSIREVLHLPRLDELSGDILDYLAEQFHLDFLEPLYMTDDEKKTLIRKSIAWHRIKGTKAAIEQLAHDAFKDAQVLEWFEYEGGKPYHFKIRSKGFKQTPDGWQTYLRMVNVAKNVRSWCDNYELYNDELTAQVFADTAELKTGSAEISIAKPKSNFETRAFVGNANLISGTATESLSKPQSNFSNVANVGVALQKSGFIKIDTKTQPSADENRFALPFKSKLFVGNALSAYERQIWNVSFPKKKFVTVNAGTAQFGYGNVTIGENPAWKNRRNVIRVGVVEKVTGYITIT